MKERKKDWVIISFFMLSPILGVLGTALYSWKFGIQWWQPVMFLVLYAMVGLSVTAGYHRYFSHRAYQTSRWFQFFLAFGAEMSTQKGVLWWAAHHRHHHRMSDQPGDTHSVAG